MNGLRGIIEAASSALSAQSLRIAITAQNLANQDSVEGPGGTPYQRRLVVFEPIQEPGGLTMGVKVSRVETDQSPPVERFDPGNPRADERGYVKASAVNPIYEMVDMLEAVRSYEANLSVAQTAKTMIQRTLDLLA